jgi:hypothetical protein
MTRLEKVLLHGGTLLVGLTGLAYAVFKYLMTNDDPFTAVNHPLQPWALALHVLAAPALVFGVGIMFKDHMLAKIKNGAPARTKRIGLSTLLLFVPMVVTGYLIQVLSAEVPRRWSIWLHIGLGIGYMVVYAGHLATAPSRAPASAPGRERVTPGAPVDRPRTLWGGQWLLLALGLGIVLASPASADDGAGGWEPGGAVHRATVQDRNHARLIALDADPLGAGRWQAQFNSISSRSRSCWNASGTRISRPRASSRQAAVGLIYGAGDSLDLGVELPYVWLEDLSSQPSSGGGAADVSLAAKWRFYGSDRSRLGLAFLPTLTLPTGRESTSGRLGPGEGVWAAQGAVVLVADLKERLSLNLDAGYGSLLSATAGGRASTVRIDAAMGYQVSSRLSPEIELNYAADAGAPSPDGRILSLTAALSITATGRLTTRAGIQQDFAGRASDRSTRLLVSLDLDL